jgi:Domain of unknown function (DUF4232)
VAGRRTGAGLVLAAVGLTAAGCLGGGGTKTVTVAHTQTITSTETVTTTGPVSSAKACRGTDLKAAFSQIPNSAGAGQIAYTLSVRNTSRAACFVQGIPQGTLLGANGTVLPTRIKASGATGKRIVLPLGASATAQARFSPSIAGQGDSQSGACQPQAHTFQLTAKGGGVTEAPIRPPTSVCQRGTLNFEAFDFAG